MEESKSPKIRDSGLESIISSGMGSKMKEYGRWGLYSIKAEIVLYELRQSLYWQSLIEIFVCFLALLLLFMANASHSYFTSFIL